MPVGAPVGHVTAHLSILYIRLRFKFRFPLVSYCFTFSFSLPLHTMGTAAAPPYSDDHLPLSVALPECPLFFTPPSFGLRPTYPETPCPKIKPSPFSASPFHHPWSLFDTHHERCWLAADLPRPTTRIECRLRTSTLFKNLPRRSRPFHAAVHQPLPVCIEISFVG